MMILNKEQISKLIKNRLIKLAEDKLIEIRDNNLILNNNGFLNYAKEMNIDFEKSEIENKPAIDFVQNLVCKHLNLTPYNVMFNLYSDGEFEFTIRLDKGIENQIVACDYNRALLNTQALDIPVNKGKNQIGLYKRLGQSAYYFRWLGNL